MMLSVFYIIENMFLYLENRLDEHIFSIIEK